MSIPLGLAGLAHAWAAARPLLGVSVVVPRAIALVAALVWLALVVVYLSAGPRQVMADLRDPVQGAFVPLAAIVPMILAVPLSTVAFSAGRVLVIVFLVMTLVLGGWLAGQWITSELSREAAHPGYYLPTVAGGLLGAYAAAVVHLHAVAVASFGIGLACWLLLGSIVLDRLFFGPKLPPPLIPTLAIEVAPPVLAGFAYFAMTGGARGVVAYLLGGYAVLMALVQLRLIPLYATLRFSLAFWAFTFPYAATATDALLWITFTHPAGATGYAVAVVTLITVFIAAIAARTVIAVARREFELLPVPFTCLGWAGGGFADTGAGRHRGCVSLTRWQLLRRSAAMLFLLARRWRPRWAFTSSWPAWGSRFPRSC